MRSTASLRFHSLLTLGASLLLGLSACSDDGLGEEAGAESSESGDGDGDPATGDGDGDPSTTNGDGDGDDPSTTGDGDGDDPSTTGDGDGDPPCVYPDAAEPMALDQPIAAYAWPEALRNNFVSAPLSLENAYCDNDEEIDWSPHDILVFISLPAW